MKNAKIFILFTQTLALVLGILPYRKTDFQVRLSKSITVDTGKYIACLDTTDTAGTNPPHHE